LGLSFFMVFGFYVWHGFLILLEDIYDNILFFIFLQGFHFLQGTKIPKLLRKRGQHQFTQQGLFSYK
jgi:hypothetical protein